MRFAELALASQAVGATASRSAKVALLAAAVRAATPEEIGVVVAYLSGELRQRRTGVGWASVRDAPAAAVVGPTLTVLEVDAAFERAAAASGPGAAGLRRLAVHDLFARATEAERAFLRGLISGDLRQGALEALVVDGVAKAGHLPAADVRRAVMLAGALAPVAAAVLAGEGTAGFGLVVGRPVQPMLASPARSVADALERTGEAAVEWKLDGVRVQVHRDGDDVAVFTRSLDDVTARVPEVVAAALALPLRSAVLDGEAIALRPDGRPRPFQETASRFASAEGAPLTTYLFDVLHRDGDDLLALPARERYPHLPAASRVPRVMTADPAVARAELDHALAHGHEGVVVKSLEAVYDAGRRGTGWLKVKPVHTLDLVVLAAEWGHGRRRGWLSNLSLGARDGAGFVMLGKTFKGLTDAMLGWQTEQLLRLQVCDDGWRVEVRPELVVEIAFDGVQASTRYPGGMALRFARVLRHRPDKRAEDADTVAAVRAVHARTA